MKRAIIAIAADPASPASAIAQGFSRYSDEGLTRDQS